MIHGSLLAVTKLQQLREDGSLKELLSVWEQELAESWLQMVQYDGLYFACKATFVVT